MRGCDGQHPTSNSERHSINQDEKVIATIIIHVSFFVVDVDVVDVAVVALSLSLSLSLC